VTNRFSFKASGTSFTIVPAATPTNKLAGSLLSTGVISGSFLNTNGNKTLTFDGVFLGPSQGGSNNVVGSGFVLDTDKKTDPFVITH
jgi:hypothetical protein